MNTQEHADSCELLRTLAGIIQRYDPTVEGFNIGMNCGAVATQSVFHAHIHLIPRRRDDSPADQRGGVSGMVPGADSRKQEGLSRPTLES